VNSFPKSPHREQRSRWGPRKNGLLRVGIPSALLCIAATRRLPTRIRVASAALLAGVWSAVYRLYRRGGLAQTAYERTLYAATTREAMNRHYNLRVPTLEEELEEWGPYHAHRHAMRYRLVGDTAHEHLREDGLVVDVGCGAALVAEHLTDVAATYVGLDLGDHHTRHAAKRLADRPPDSLHAVVGRSDAEALPLRSGCADVVVITEVIEHLLEPVAAAWELARVLRPGGVLVLTTNNACEAPLRSPLSHVGAWLEKAIGAGRPQLVSLRPWVWPEPVDPEILPEARGRPVYVPHTHHIPGELTALLARAGLQTLWWSTFEFPPPQSATASFLARLGEPGLVAADTIESVARHTPLLKRLGTHLFVVARKVREPAGEPPRFSDVAAGPSGAP